MVCKGKNCFSKVQYMPGDCLLFGPETRGLPVDIRQSLGEDNVIRLPMQPDSRSLNLSNAVSIVTYEAWRQLDFAGSQRVGAEQIYAKYHRTILWQLNLLHRNGGGKIRDAIQAQMPEQKVDVHNIANNCIHLIPQYHQLILGIPTWDYGELQEDWETHWQQLDGFDLSHTKVAIFGLGDQIGYPQWFQDALGYLWAKVVNQGASAIGLWPIKVMILNNQRR